MPEYPYKLPSQTPRGKALACRFVCWATYSDEHDGTLRDLPMWDDALSPPAHVLPYHLFGRVDYPDGRQPTYEAPNVIRHMAARAAGKPSRAPMLY